MVDLKRYRKATSYSRSVQLLGYTVGSVLGQLLVSFDLMSYDNIMVFTLVLTAIALFTSCLLPMPQQSMFFHRKHTGQKTATEGAKGHVDGVGDATEHTSGSKGSEEGVRVENADIRGEMEDEAGTGLEEKGLKVEDLGESVGTNTCGKVLCQLWRDFRQCYSSRQLLYWSVWWAMATCGYNQTVNYVQVSCKGNTHKSRTLKPLTGKCSAGKWHSCAWHFDTHNPNTCQYTALSQQHFWIPVAPPQQDSTVDPPHPKNCSEFTQGTLQRSQVIN